MWEIIIIKETKDGYLCSSPNGDTQWVTKEEYQRMIEKKRPKVT